MAIRIIIFVILGNLNSSALYCLQCMIHSSIKSSKHVLNEFFSFFNRKKSDSTTVVSGKMIASPPLKAIKCRNRVSTDSHPPEKLLWHSCSSNICLSDVSFDIARFKPLWSSSISLINSRFWITRSLSRWSLKIATKSRVPNLIHWCDNTAGNLDSVDRFYSSLSLHIFWIPSIIFSTNWATFCATSFRVYWSKASDFSIVNDPWS